MERKKIIFAVIFLVVISLLIGVFFYLINKQNELANQNKSGQQIVNKTEKRWPMMIRAENVSKEICEKINTKKEKNNCMIRLAYQEASSKDDPSYCLSINDYAMRNDCVYKQMVITKDPKQCERIASQDFKERCLEDIGQGKLGIKYCDEIKDDLHEKQECIDRFSAMSLNDVKPNLATSSVVLIKKCDGIKTLEYSYLCEVNAIKNGRGSCENLQNESQRKLCISRVLYSKAKAKNDCEKIPDERYKKVCLSIFNNLNNKDYKFDDDNDGLNNEKELWINTDPFKADTDGDGLSDYDEYNKYKTDPIEFNDKNKVIVDYNQKEQARVGKDLTTDSDNDGLTDADEIFYGTDYKNPDTKKLGMTDGEAVKRGLIKAK